MAVSIVGIFILLVVLLTALFVVTLLLALLAKLVDKNKGVRDAFGGVVAVGILLMLFAGYFLFSARVSSPPQAINSDVVETLPQSHEATVTGLQEFQAEPPESSPGVSDSPDITIAGNPWTDAVEEFQNFQADVYPSIEAAAEALGRRVGQQLIETGVSADEPKRMVYVWQDEDLEYIDRGVLESVVIGLIQKLDDPAYISIERPPTQDSVAVNLALQDIRFDNHNRWRTHTESRSGAIALRVLMPEGPFSVSTRFNETPWIVDRTSFASDYTNGDWLVGYSDGTHSKHKDAKRDAILAASDALLPLAQARINRLSASDQHHFVQQMAKDPNWLRDKVADELVSRNLATDRFAQRFDRPYGTVWREAVLVDASPSRVEEIARSLVQGLDSKIAQHRATWFSFAALLGLLFGTYLFLNLATKGYYAWSLRTAVVIGIIGLVFAMRTIT